MSQLALSGHLGLSSILSRTIKEFSKPAFFQTWRFASNNTIPDSLRFTDWKPKASPKNSLQSKLYGTGLKERRQIEGKSFEALIRSSHPIKNDKRKQRNKGSNMRKPNIDPTQFTKEKPGSEKKNLSPKDRIMREERRLVQKLEKIRNNQVTFTQAPKAVKNTTAPPSESLSEFTIEKTTPTPLDDNSLREDTEGTRYSRRKLVVE